MVPKHRGRPGAASSWIVPEMAEEHLSISLISGSAPSKAGGGAAATMAVGARCRPPLRGSPFRVSRAPLHLSRHASDDAGAECPGMVQYWEKSQWWDGGCCASGETRLWPEAMRCRVLRPGQKLCPAAAQGSATCSSCSPSPALIIGLFCAHNAYYCGYVCHEFRTRQPDIPVHRGSRERQTARSSCSHPFKPLKSTPYAIQQLTASCLCDALREQSMRVSYRPWHDVNAFVQSATCTQQA
jgi:hypothetical protein